MNVRERVRSPLRRPATLAAPLSSPRGRCPASLVEKCQAGLSRIGRVPCRLNTGRRTILC
eukprot:3279840-Heterocapsa_arctica.AAC.1